MYCGNLTLVKASAMKKLNEKQNIITCQSLKNLLKQYQLLFLMNYHLICRNNTNTRKNLEVWHFAPAKLNIYCSNVFDKISLLKLPVIISIKINLPFQKNKKHQKNLRIISELRIKLCNIISDVFITTSYVRTLVFLRS